MLEQQVAQLFQARLHLRRRAQQRDRSHGLSLLVVDGGTNGESGTGEADVGGDPRFLDLLELIQEHLHELRLVCAAAPRMLNVTIAGADITVGSSTSDLSTDCDKGTYAVGSVGSRTSR